MITGGGTPEILFVAGIMFGLACLARLSGKLLKPLLIWLGVLGLVAIGSEIAVMFRPELQCRNCIKPADDVPDRRPPPPGIIRI
jgi:hypothetical protein